MRWRPCESRQDGFGKRNGRLALGVWRTTNDKRYLGCRVPGSEVISCIVVLMLIPVAWWCRCGESFLSLTSRLPAEILVVEGWVGRDGIHHGITPLVLRPRPSHRSFTFGGLATKTTPSTIDTTQNLRYARTISLTLSSCCRSTLCPFRAHCFSVAVNETACNLQPEPTILRAPASAYLCRSILSIISLPPCC